ncbi:MAG: hypothetical protein MUQ56_02810 [Thermoleophilia bacterium]|nr:hypothetical protein [Thermoleophilia bacterium]
MQVEVTPVPRRPKSGQQQAPDADKEANVTRVLVDDEWIPIGLREELDVIRYPDPEPPKGLEGYDLYYWMRRHRKEPDYVLGGRLALFINSENLGVRRTWRDAQTQRVEKCLNTFVAHLYMTALAIREERIAAERRRLERIEEQRLWAEEQKRRQEAERRRRIEERRQKDLDGHLERWQRSRDVRNFLFDAHSVLTKAGLPAEETEGVKAWLAWVEDYAARLDPLIGLPETAAHTDRPGPTRTV